MTEDRPIEVDGSQNVQPKGAQPVPDAGTISTVKLVPWQIWLLSAAAVVSIAGSGWWLLAPKPKVPETNSTALLATAPPPANPHPHDQDGTPLSK